MLTDKHLGRTVPWHFDSPDFEYKGRMWRIVWNVANSNKLSDTLYTIRDSSDGKEYEVTHANLVRRILAERSEQSHTS